ncbi:hypothetical protein, partial [Pseudomonas aeruginosa]|uniref:hypothetical protein n=1 Tax=Pseudomonas aeruginosa TaxID=287 RepID=UPI00402BB6D2
AEFGIRHRGSTVPERSGVALSFCRRRQIKTVLDTAQAPYKGSTVIGHALSKHAGRHPEIWGKVKGSMSGWNEQAMKHFKEIVRAPGEFRPTMNEKGITFLEKRLIDGRGVRLNLDGTFKGFID